MSAIALATLLVVAGAARSIARTRDWHDGVSLWSSAVRAVPEGSGRIYGELGLAFLREGREQEAIPLLTKALEVGPEKSDFHSNLGKTLLHVGRVPEAVVHLRRALAMDPGSQLIRYNLALALLQEGARDEALGHLQVLLEDATWKDVSPLITAALAERNTSVEQLRAAIRGWMVLNGFDGGRAP